MKLLKDIHTTSSTIAGMTVMAVLWAISDTRWWSCSDGGLQVLQNWSYGSAAFIASLGLAITARHFNYGEKLRHWTEIGLRLMLLYSLITIALIKLEGVYYDVNLVTKEHKLSELEPATLLSAFHGYSSTYEVFTGAVLLAGLLLMSFTQTKRLGIITLIASLGQAVMMDYSFDSCFIMKDSIWLSGALCLLYFHMFDFISFFTGTKPLVNYTTRSFEKHSHLHQSANVYKLVLLAGLLFYNHDYVKGIKDYKGRNSENPIAGVWKVDKIDFLTGNMPEETKLELSEFDEIIIEKDRFGAVKVGDSISYFEFIINPQDHQLEFWNFFDYRELDLKGRYEQLDDETLLYTGRNNKDSLQILFTLESK